ncbi:unnamed protein product [Adineta ricciae]|uniref:Uncharacterized protein n=1 Tax=Adineta ricciae TaxID=249248 RepID=A0A814FB59_ADIRI|nr:unnamed protein product [Adineta ricciae]
MAASPNMLQFIMLGIIAVFGIITFALAAASVGTLNKRDNEFKQQLNALSEQIANLKNSTTIITAAPTTTTTTTITSASSSPSEGTSNTIHTNPSETTASQAVSLTSGPTTTDNTSPTSH